MLPFCKLKKKIVIYYNTPGAIGTTCWSNFMLSQFMEDLTNVFMQHLNLKRKIVHTNSQSALTKRHKK